MNRIVLIGNGFDLAHGLATKYSDFLNDYWNDLIISKLKDKSFGNGLKHEDEDIKIDLKQGDIILENSKNYTDLISCLPQGGKDIQFKNKFLEIISKNHSIKNWVDIENEYYSFLLKILKKEKINGVDLKIEKLNSDFERIIILLKKYLVKIQNDFFTTTNSLKYTDEIKSKIYSDYIIQDLIENFSKKIIDLEYQKYLKLKKEVESNKNLEDKENGLINRLNHYNLKEDFMELLKDHKIAPNFFDLRPESFMFLNFNYTVTQKLYKDYNYISEGVRMIKPNVETIHIHGSLNEADKNPIIFGYGDELDEDYAAIEKLNDNKFLENIKSIKYFETDNYKRLLEYINSDQYQVFIFGHSCGLSDRTLLNTLFEHKNCVSIKPFYHQWRNEDDSLGDNYSDIVRNISRNFNNKASMRDKVVNKTYCEPLLEVIKTK